MTALVLKAVMVALTWTILIMLVYSCPWVDCWALAALTAVDESQPDPANKIDFTLFHYGRETCPEGNLLGNWVNEVADFPSPHLTSDALINYFAGEFTFSPDETVAIMGAHTLGTLSNNRSGFSGAWVHGERIFDNEFYQFLVMNAPDGTTTASTSFVQDNALNSNLAYSWVHQSPGSGPAGGRPEIMLNSDMALVYDFADYMTMGSDDGMVSCTLNADGSGAPLCDTTAPTLNKVIEYSQDNVQWTMDFHAAFTKMLLKGHDTSHCLPQELCDVSM